MSQASPTERAEQIEAVLLALASPDMGPSWPRIFGSLAEDQPPEVAQRLAFFRPVASILESGELNLLDPLPPEQREFVQEVLRKFETNQRA